MKVALLKLQHKEALLKMSDDDAVVITTVGNIRGALSLAASSALLATVKHNNPDDSLKFINGRLADILKLLIEKESDE